MGQCQFMPSSFLKFAEDWDGDGRRDIWTTRADVLASAANYLLRSGWNGDQTWGRAAKLPAASTPADQLEVRKPLAGGRVSASPARGKPATAADRPVILAGSAGRPDRRPPTWSATTTGPS
jgi:membrane-bound lytic murein transglycosylase B